jgi:hypothetical protein
VDSFHFKRIGIEDLVDYVYIVIVDKNDSICFRGLLKMFLNLDHKFFSTFDILQRTPLIAGLIEWSMVMSVTLSDRSHFSFAFSYSALRCAKVKSLSPSSSTGMSSVISVHDC